MGEPEAVDSSDSDGLLTWGLASFHTALLVALVLGGLYAAGVAGELLTGLDTWIGIVAYLYLWAVTWWTNRRLLSRIEGDLVTERPGASALLAEAMKWGALAGLLVFLPALLVGIVLFVGAGGLGAVPFLLVGGAIGATLATGIGVVVGVLFVLLDLLLVRAARRWLPADTPAPVSNEA